MKKSSHCFRHDVCIVLTLQYKSLVCPIVVMTDIQVDVGQYFTSFCCVLLDNNQRSIPTLPPYGWRQKNLWLDNVKCGMSLCDVLNSDVWAWLPSGRSEEFFNEVTHGASHNGKTMSHDLWSSHKTTTLRTIKTILDLLHQIRILSDVVRYNK